VEGERASERTSGNGYRPPTSTAKLTTRFALRSGGNDNFDIFIQAGGQHLSRLLSLEKSFQDELCTGFYFIRANIKTAMFLRATIVELSLHDSEEEKTFGDQSAFNLVLFEWRFRYSDELNVSVLSPLLFPGGSVFFEYHDLAYGGNKLPAAVIVHNNFLIGREKKIERFKRRGMWFAEREERNFFGVLEGGGGGREPDLRFCPCPFAFLGSRREAVSR